jgi:hypothetical protein
VKNAELKKLIDCTSIVALFYSSYGMPKKHVYQRMKEKKGLYLCAALQLYIGVADLKDQVLWPYMLG